MTQSKKIVLVIEDEEPILGVIAFKLKQEGFEVITARTADQALEYMEDIPNIDFIWLDHYLEGDRNGLEFVEVVKRPDSNWRAVYQSF